MSIVAYAVFIQLITKVNFLEMHYIEYLVSVGRYFNIFVRCMKYNTILDSV